MKVLIVKLSSLGDCVHTLPSLSSLRLGLGKAAEIDWLVEEAAAGLLAGHPMIDELMVVKRRGWTSETGANLAVVRKLRARRYDMVLDFQGLFKSALWVGLSGAGRRIGFSNARELSGFSYNEKLPPYDPDMHAVERYLLLAGYAGGRKGEVVFPVHTGSKAAQKVSRLLAEAGIENGSPIVTMLPSARWPTKLWGADKFAELIKKISAAYGMRVLLAGSSSDKAYIEEISAGSAGAGVNLAGKTSIKELARLLELSRVSVTVDSGPMHIAAAVGSRVVALFGPTAPWRTGPYGPDHIVLRKGLDCSPCFKRDCGDVRCMDEITVSEVMEAFESAIGR